MAHNISNQTYKNIEWIVVDDYKENRATIMQEYCDKYGIDGRYIRGTPKKHRKYSLAQANNKAWQSAEGELFVFLQDFIIMPVDGIERLVDIYRHNPDALIAPVDTLHKSRIKPDTSKEDWFAGEVDVIGDYVSKNIRCKNIGMRESNNPYDFEQNYAAVPMKIIRELNGWYEFFDDALGYDNTEFAFRAMDLGYRLIVDDTNECTSLDHWEPLKGNDEETGGHDRQFSLNDPRYLWLIDQIDNKKLPHKRDEAQDDSISLKYTVPDVEDKAKWMKENAKKIKDSFRL
ncbi:glycosyltransferase family 2 protein [Candidatus Micrarchaeota archaeon]|nr:glycosyltransferase family 2 protein [Candidatus Micrarchaeota archaeon]